MKTSITIDGVEYVQRKHLDEALDLISRYREIYDDLAGSQTDLTPKEKAAERKLTARWSALLKKLGLCK